MLHNAATPPPSIPRPPPLNSLSLPSTSPLPPFQPTTDQPPPSPPAKAIAALIPPPAPPSVVSHVASSVKNVPIGLAIIGTLLGVVFIVVIIALLIVCSRKRKNDHGPPNSDRSTPPSPSYDYRSPPQELQQIFYPPLVHGIPMPWNILPPPIELSMSTSTEDLYSPKLQGNNIPVGGFSGGNFTIQELALATGIFSKKNLVGEGEFGSCVFKGVLPNGRRIAVKRLNYKGMMGRQGERELFVEEVEIISRVHHKHLVQLVGYCMTSDDQRFLVYEFVPNNSLELHLHGKDQPVMEWATRMKIAIGSAKGLAYLHEDCNPCIIHGGFKASNILLDSKFEAKVADFGLKKLSVDTGDDDDDDIQHKYNRVAGTFGYVAPDKATRERESEKSDVFSYGVMLLELITGRKPLNKSDPSIADCLVSWAKPLLTKAMENKNYDDLVDPRLQSDYDIEEMATIFACAAACLRDSVLSRPRMSQITLSLEGDISVCDLDEGIKSGHI